MKKLLLIIVTFFLSTAILAQVDSLKNEKNSFVTIGILQGGGSLVGLDYEILLTNTIGLQAGAGIFGFGGGLNFHFRPSIRSSLISLQYWHQGIGDSFAQSAIGPNYVFRGNKWFTFQIGLGLPLDKGPAMPDDFKQPPVMLLYSIGAYIHL
jgi:hypothetical protein